MPFPEPKLAVVRPRVRWREEDSPRLLEEFVEEYVEEHPTGFVWLVGAEGTGKTTALAHLSAIFEQDQRLSFVDDADQLETLDTCAEYREHSNHRLIVAARRHAISTGHKVLQLEPWGVDELIEYMLAVYPSKCDQVLGCISEEAKQLRKPEVAKIVLEQIVHNPELKNATNALQDYVAKQLNESGLLDTAQRLCLAYDKGDSGKAMLSLSEITGAINEQLKKLLKEPLIKIPFAAEHILQELRTCQTTQVLEGQLSRELVQYLGKECCNAPELLRRLEAFLEYSRDSKSFSMAASILLATNSKWLPTKVMVNRNYSGAYFSRAHWPNQVLEGTHLELAEFSGAILTGANLNSALLVETDFIDSNLRKASLSCAVAIGANFSKADLEGADLTRLKLDGASLVDANLSDAILYKASLCLADLSNACFQNACLANSILIGANLNETNFRNVNLRRAYARKVDLRTAQLENADLEEICLNGAILEDIQWKRARLHKARLRRANLTGSKLSLADLSEANLKEARLGEIEWENANLRNANLSGVTFHMGSSRSGLIDSPIASEGSRTGYYTDDLEELYFKSPEEVCKANLRGADLRGANVTNVDFYLVDLRGAKLDQYQRQQALQTGAIL